MCTECYKLAADRTRHTLLTLLKKESPMPVGKLAAKLQVSQPTTTHHLKKLEKAGLVRMLVSGREHLYALSMKSECFSECGLLEGI